MNKKVDWSANRVTAEERKSSLATESVEGTSLALQGVDDIKRSDGLAFGVFRVRDSIANDTLQKRLENATRFLVDHGRDTLDTTTAGKTTNSGLGNTLDVVT